MKFIDLFGQWHHLTIPSAFFTEETFSSGVAFDGSSVGFKTVEAGDMVLIPRRRQRDTIPSGKSRRASALPAPPKRTPRLFPPGTREESPGGRKNSSQSTGIADQSLWSPEFEFYIFDSVSYKNDINMASYIIDSSEADWNSGLMVGKEFRA